MCQCYECVRANTSMPQTTVTSFGGLTPPMQWCGVHHAHGPHQWVAPSGLYAQCPGSTCRCDDDAATEDGDT